MNTPNAPKDTPAWIFFVWTSFITSACLMLAGIFYMPVDFWIKGYFTMGLFFLTGSVFTLSKTIRDNHEAQKFINRMVDARTEKILSDYELKNK